MKRKEELPECPIATTVSLIGSKWKLLIIRNLSSRPYRFNELQKSLEGISQKVLTTSLRELADDGIIYRIMISWKRNNTKNWKGKVKGLKRKNKQTSKV